MEKERKGRLRGYVKSLYFRLRGANRSIFSKGTSPKQGKDRDG